MLHITDLSVAIDGTSIIKKLTLSIPAGAVHAIMGPNGSGKSTLAHVLMGHPAYQVTGGSLFFDTQDITELSPDKRARAGLFLAFQHPYALPGVRVFTFLKEAHRAVTGADMPVIDFAAQLKAYCALLAIDESFLERSLNDGFSGGEKKRFELLQLLVLKPKLAVLDEIDSGLDIDALKAVAQALAYAQKENPSMSLLLITHYQRILEHVVPDRVHVLCDGRIAESGTMQLVRTIESRGYHAYR